MKESTEGVAAGQTSAMDYENAADSTENDAKRLQNRTDWTKNELVSEESRYVCLRYSAYRRAEVNVANTYQENRLCYVLSIVSGKNRHINDRAKNRR